MTSPQGLHRGLEVMFQFARQERYADALLLGEELRLQNPSDAKVPAQLGYVHARKQDFDAAIREISTALRLAPDEPAYYFDRALWNLEAGHLSDAIADCTSSIAIETGLNRRYYLGPSYFVRAVANARRGEYQSALDDCQHVADDTVFWALGELQSKNVLIEQLTKRLGPP
ncbi:MAG: small glutamine-rich tetratricopeptide repeat-containing protein beta [Pseudomonadota bacterium]